MHAEIRGLHSGAAHTVRAVLAPCLQLVRLVRTGPTTVEGREILSREYPPAHPFIVGQDG